MTDLTEFTAQPQRLEANMFMGDTEGFLEWAVRNWRPNGVWCPVHFAPAPVEGANGRAMTKRVMAEITARMPSRIRDNPALKDAWILKHGAEQTFCCQLGDETMDRLWALTKQTTADFERRMRL